MHPIMNLGMNCELCAFMEGEAEPTEQVAILTTTMFGDQEEAKQDLQLQAVRRLCAN